MKKIELLAPAGNFEALKAAVEAGADAIYLAGSAFGARAYAGNFTNEQLAEAVKFAHLRGVAVHVTVNTIVADSEISALADYLKYLNEINVDAILVQDLGIAAIARKFAPNIPLHASTQMCIHSIEGVHALEELGFSRIVLARELSLDEIAFICKNSTAEIEVFMHGALCICYSGQCLMSSMIGARSGNRGRCAQPCRLPYNLVDESNTNILKNGTGQYLLSPKDLNTLDILPQLIESGVDSLKIEGRMKRPEYVAIVVETYRKALDNVEHNSDAQRRLAQIFNRDFTTAYLERNQGRNMISDMRPNNRGLLLGRVIKVSHNSIDIKANLPINCGDQLEIWVKVGGRVTFTVDSINKAGDIYTIDTKNILRGIKIHDRVFKVFDAELTEHARKFFTSAAPIRKLPIDIKFSAKLNQNIHITCSDIDDTIIEISSIVTVTKAINKPLDESLVRKQLSRLGNTIFYLRNLSLDIDDDIMVPISELNELRRRAVDALENSRLTKNNNVKHISSSLDTILVNNSIKPYKPEQTLLNVAVDNLEALKIAINAGAHAILFGGESYHHANISPQTYQTAIQLAHNAGRKLFIATPRIVRNADQPALEKIISICTNNTNFIPDGIYVHNIATLRLVRRLSDIPIHSDFSLITFNSATIQVLNTLNVKSITLSPELTLEQIKSIAKVSPLPLECLIHGRIELMISQYCTLGSFLGGVGEKKCSQPCHRSHFFLKDRKDTLFPIVTDQFCHMHILNSKPLSMLPHIKTLMDTDIKFLRIDARYIPNNELSNTIKLYLRTLSGDSISEPDDFDFTRGHFFRGV